MSGRTLRPSTFTPDPSCGSPLAMGLQKSSTWAHTEHTRSLKLDNRYFRISPREFKSYLRHYNTIQVKGKRLDQGIFSYLQTTIGPNNESLLDGVIDWWLVMQATIEQIVSTVLTAVLDLQIPIRHHFCLRKLWVRRTWVPSPSWGHTCTAA